MSIKKIEWIGGLDKQDATIKNVPDEEKVVAVEFNDVRDTTNINADKLGDLDLLNTTDKSSSVGAINEVMGSINTKTETVTEGSTDVVESGGVFNFRHNQYPFKETMLPFLNSGFDLASFIIDASFEFYGAVTKYTTSNGVKNFYLDGFGDDGAGSYFVRIGRQQTGGGYSINIINVDISGVSDEKAIVFKEVTSSYSIELLCDFSEAKNYNVSGLQPNDKADFEPILVKDSSDINTTSYPFDSGMTPTIASDVNLFDYIKYIDIGFVNGITKYTDNDGVKKFYIQGIGKNGSNQFFLNIGRQKPDGTYGIDSILVDESSVSDVKSVVFKNTNTSYYEYFVIDFSVLQDKNITNLQPNNNTNISPLFVKDDSDIIVDIQQNPKNFGKSFTENMFKSFKNSIDLSSDIYNGSYSWWCRPHCFTESNHSYINYIGEGGDQLSFDNTENNITALNTQKLYDKDEHNTSASFRMSNGKWIYAYTGHEDDTFLRVRTGVDSVSKNESRERVFNIGSGLTYSQIVEFNGFVIIATRYNLSSWQILYSSDYGYTFKKLNFLVQGVTSYNQMYLMLQMTGTKYIKLYQYYHPSQALDNNRVSYGVIDIETLLVYDKEGGSQIADLNSSACVADDLKVLYNVTSGYQLRLLDCSGDSTTEAIFTVAEMQIADESIGDYKLIEYNLSNDTATNTSVSNHGGYFTHTYVGGCYIRQGLQGETDSNIIIYTSRKDGVDWIIEKYTVSSGVPSLTTTISTNTTPIVRPVPPLGSISGVGVEIFYIEGTYENNSFEDWNTVIKKVDY